MKPTIISIDHGNTSIKTIHETFTAGLISSPERLAIGDEIIHYDGLYWALSEKRLPHTRDKTENRNYYALTLFAIMKELKRIGDIGKEAGQEIVLAAGLPPQHMRPLAARFRDYLTGEVKLQYNGTDICLNVNRAHIFPQALAAISERITELTTISRMIIIDIGGYTVDVVEFRKGRPNLDMVYSFDMGTIVMINRLISDISSQFGLHIEDVDIQDVMSGQNTMLPESVQKYIQAAVREYTDDLLMRLREKQIELKATQLIFAGGGSLLLRPYIEGSALIAKADIIDDVRANAIGYQRLAERIEDRL